MSLRIYSASMIALLTMSCSQNPQRNRVDRQPLRNTVSENVVQQGNDPVEKTKTGDSAKPTTQETKPIPTPQPAVAALPSAQLDVNFVTAFLDQIAGNQASGRLTGSPQNKAVADLIAKEFMNAGLQPGGTNQTFFQAFTANSAATGSVTTQNIIGVLPGKEKPQEVIIVGAHMDHLGVRNNQTFFGADDNASGTTALVAAAKALGKVKDQLQRTVVFIAFSAEELGLLGSMHYVKNPTYPLTQIKFMLNMDMVGYSNGNLDAIGFAKTLEADGIVKELINKSGLTPKYYATAGGGSDHMPFEQMNIPTGVFHTGLHANYHKPTDSLEKIDRSNLGKIAGLVADLTFLLARSPTLKLRPLEMEPAQYMGFASTLHGRGCAPEFVSFEELEQSLSDLRGL